MREIPNIELHDVKGYAKPLANGWDTVKETFDVIISERLVESLEMAKREARGENKDGVVIQFGGEEMMLRPYGTKSAIFVLENDDFRIFMRSPKMHWPVSIEYSAAGLWEYGLHALRERAINALVKECPPKCARELVNDIALWQRVSVAHYAFDFHSEEFSRDMTPAIFSGIVCPAPVKKSVNFSMDCSAHGRGVTLETLTIGKKDTLQVQIYNKGQEITDISGKDWMFKVWAQSGYVVPKDKNGKAKPKDVWRLECRFGSNFLKDRAILTIDDLLENLSALVTEAIFTRRLTVESVTDKNRWRWALHPLFVSAYKQTDGLVEMLPLGRVQTESIEAKKDRIKKAIAGNVRALTVLDVGDMDELDAWQFVIEAYQLLLDDPDGDKKTERAQMRYHFVREAA